MPNKGGFTGTKVVLLQLVRGILERLAAPASLPLSRQGRICSGRALLAKEEIKPFPAVPGQELRAEPDGIKRGVNNKPTPRDKSFNVSA